MSRHHSVVAVVAVSAASIVASASGQIASAVLREGQVLTEGVVGGIEGVATNHVGGYVVNTAVGGIDAFFGNPSGGAGSVLRMEGTYGPLVQTSFESFFGYSDAGKIGYSASGTGGPVGAFDSVWRDSDPIAVQGDPSPSEPGRFWVFGSRPGITGDGKLYWAGGTATTAGGSTSNRGVYFGDSATPIHLGGTVVPGFGTLTSSTVSFNYRMSRFGTNFIIDGQVTGATATDTGMMLNGSLMMIGGSPTREGSPVPASVGGLPGENWANWDYMGVSESGNYMITGDTSAATSQDAFILINGQIVMREGMPLPGGGGNAAGAIDMAYMNENGDYAAIWDVNPGTGAVESLIFNGSQYLKIGDLVDLDGDGFVEPNSKLSDFTGIASMQISDRYGPGFVDIYFTADVDTLGTPSLTDDTEGAFKITVLIPAPGTIVLALAGIPMLRRRR